MFPQVYCAVYIASRYIHTQCIYQRSAMIRFESYIYNFWYLYTFILILILYSHYSYSKFEVLIVLIPNNTRDLVNFDSLWLNTQKESQNNYNSHTNTTILSRRLCVCFACCLWIFLSTFFVNEATTKIVTVDEWFESLEKFISFFFQIYESE